jgi:hypothetical protein
MKIYNRLVFVLAVVTVLIGFLLIVITAARGGGVGLLIGALFVAAGTGRLWLLRGKRR